MIRGTYRERVEDFIPNRPYMRQTRPFYVMFGFLHHMREPKREYVRGRTTKKARPFVYQPMGETLRHSLESGVTGQLGTLTFSRQSGIRFG